MQRFFFDNEQLTDGSFEVAGEKFKHITKVLRMSQGENAVFCDGNDTDYLCTLYEISSNTAIFKILNKYPNNTESSLKITIYQCIPKGEKMDEMVKRCVQFGADKIVPVLSRRCVSRPDPRSAAKKIERLNKISLSSAMQSMRGHIPVVADVIDYETALDQMKQQTCFICYEEENKTKLKDLKIEGDKVAFLIGPEGGLDSLEIDLAKEKSIPCITLGKRILRTEDAAAFCIPILLSLTNNI